MLVILGGKSLDESFEKEMTLEKAQKYLKEYNDNIFHPKYYQSLLFMKEKEIIDRRVP